MARRSGGGADWNARGGIVDVTKNLGPMVPRFDASGQLASLDSAGGGVSVRGSSIWSAGWGTDPENTRIERGRAHKGWVEARQRQPMTLPEYSQGVPDSIAMAYRSIAAANDEGELE
jgi:hypothetical protein